MSIIDRLKTRKHVPEGKRSKDVIVCKLCQNYTDTRLMHRRLLTTLVINLVGVGRSVVDYDSRLFWVCHMWAM